MPHEPQLAGAGNHRALSRWRDALTATSPPARREAAAQSCPAPLRLRNPTCSLSFARLSGAHLGASAGRSPVLRGPPATPVGATWSLRVGPRRNRIGAVQSRNVSW